MTCCRVRRMVVPHSVQMACGRRSRAAAKSFSSLMTLSQSHVDKVDCLASTRRRVAVNHSLRTSGEAHPSLHAFATVERADLTFLSSQSLMAILWSR